jgi:hypothetical protein
MLYPVSPKRLLGECVTCRCARFGETDTAQALRLEQMAKALDVANQRIRMLTDANEVQRAKLERVNSLFDAGIRDRAKQERETRKKEEVRQRKQEEEAIAIFGLKNEVRELIEMAMHWKEGRKECEWLKQALALAYQMGEIEIELEAFSLTALLRAGALELGDSLTEKGGEHGTIYVSGEDMNSLIAVIGNASGYYRRPEDWISATLNKRIPKNRVEKQLREIVVKRRSVVIGSLFEIWQEALQKKCILKDQYVCKHSTLDNLQFDAASLQQLGLKAVSPVRAIVAGCASWTHESASRIARAVTELLAAWSQAMQLLATVARLKQGL